MSDIEIWFLAVGLAMDCLAVSITSGIILQRVQWRPMLTMALCFGLFQGLMPLIGWFGSTWFSDLFAQADHWIAFAILAFLGGRMVKEALHADGAEHHEFDPTSLPVILALSVATSIDALAVGVSFACLGLRGLSEIGHPVLVIGLVSSVLSWLGLQLGIRFGQGFARRLKAELWGGLILILIGVKILCEHLSQ